MDYIIIPARIESSRLPGKPLLNKTGKYLIQHTWEKCIQCESFDDTYIATNSNELRKICEKFGAKVIMTDEAVCGTHRCIEAANYLIEPNLLCNVQCEYPEIDSNILDALKCVHTKNTITTAYYLSRDINEYFNENYVKLVKGTKYTLYFSRSPIPYQIPFRACGIHIGIYLFAYAQLKPLYETSELLSSCENLEQITWLTEHIPIISHITGKKYFAIDTPKDYEEFVTRTI